MREVIAVEPEPRLRRIAETEATTVPVEVRVVDGVASQLPLEDGSCDIGVASLVLWGAKTLFTPRDHPDLQAEPTLRRYTDDAEKPRG